MHSPFHITYFSKCYTDNLDADPVKDLSLQLSDMALLLKHLLIVIAQRHIFLGGSESQSTEAVDAGIGTSGFDGTLQAEVEDRTRLARHEFPISFSLAHSIPSTEAVPGEGIIGADVTVNHSHDSDLGIRNMG
nr:hypothetical protein Iba_chr01dCG0350 [Ipomoea batatas]